MTDKKIVQRPPVIVVLGHIDHGKSSLLDYIRKTNVVDGEVGGITQHISSYEVVHQGESGERSITFLDTPGHAAFSSVRDQGIKAADIAILIVSAEDGVKPQTKEAFGRIREENLPFIVAINKIDKDGADIERTKSSLIENEIYLEGQGGSVPAVAISAKNGTNIDELLDTILLLADMEELVGDGARSAEGVVLESDVDPKKGVRATLVIKDGVLTNGMTVAAGQALCPVRMMFNFKGEPIAEAGPSSPIDLIGWNIQPVTGSDFVSFSSKKEAEAYCLNYSGPLVKEGRSGDRSGEEIKDSGVFLIIKSDTSGSLAAIEKEIRGIEDKLGVSIKTIDTGLGSVSENDVKNALITEGTVVIGFSVSIDSAADRVKDQHGVTVRLFNLIYELTDWLSDHIETHRPRTKVEQVTGSLKILKVFSRVKNKNVVGGKVVEGKLSVGDKVNVRRSDEVIGQGVIKELQQQKAATPSVTDGSECGLLVESEVEIKSDDQIDSFTVQEV